jgi:hypothetical protein
MESRQEQVRSEKDQKRQMLTIAPEAPEKETPEIVVQETELTLEKTQLKPAGDAERELAVILKQIRAYFNQRTRNLDLEALHFSLTHLFSHVDLLYRQALPELNKWTTYEQSATTGDMLQRQKVWLQLQAINRALDRMAPVCHLLSDVIECLLDTLDREELWLRTIDEEETRLLEQVKSPALSRPIIPTPRPSERPDLIAPEGWEQAVAALMDRLLVWQEQHNKLVPFEQHFATPILLACNLSELDSAFATLLDSAGAIFGDILPNFRLIRPEDHEEISALLFDLMQQSDQMLAQFELTLEPLTRLIRHFALVNENN